MTRYQEGKEKGGTGDWKMGWGGHDSQSYLERVTNCIYQVATHRRELGRAPRDRH